MRQIWNRNVNFNHFVIKVVTTNNTIPSYRVYQADKDGTLLHCEGMEEGYSAYLERFEMPLGGDSATLIRTEWGSEFMPGKGTIQYDTFIWRVNI